MRNVEIVCAFCGWVTNEAMRINFRRHPVGKLFPPLPLLAPPLFQQLPTPLLVNPHDSLFSDLLATVPPTLRVLLTEATSLPRSTLLTPSTVRLAPQELFTALKPRSTLPAREPFLPNPRSALHDLTLTSRRRSGTRFATNSHVTCTRPVVLSRDLQAHPSKRRLPRPSSRPLRLATTLHD